MGVKFSEDVVPLSDIKVNPGKIVRRTSETHRPVLLTSRGRGVAVVQSISDWYREQLVPEVGEHFIKEIISLVGKLTDHPDRGRIVPEFNQPALRELIHPPFRIVYSRRPKKVSVVRVWRS